jgi:quercetin 2,3-dioxygenase
VKQKTRIILSEIRKENHLEGKLFSRWSIARDDTNDHPTRHFGSLHLFSETTLAAQNKEQLVFDEDMQFLIIPIIGGVRVQHTKNQNTVEVGEALLISLESGEKCTIFNDFENSEVHYVVAAFASSEPAEGIVRFSITSDILQTIFNQVSERGLIKAAIGQWKGRSEGKFVPSAPNIFAWVVEGAFEIENCLLQKADGLAINGAEKIEFEALSIDAIIIFLEIA